MEVLLTRLLGGGLWRKMEWAALGRTELDDLRSNLEANKVSLNLAIDLIDLSVTQDVKKDAGAVKKITNQILADTTDKKLDRLLNWRRRRFYATEGSHETQIINEDQKTRPGV
ncbi:hypothetical protein E2P81_ATG08528 [Venturia nashicola]|nr:hypothetical protein E2P81_ATG08528 [Venturia nashicola]